MLPMVETFSILAVGTSLIGTLLGFSLFFVEQLSSFHASVQVDKMEILFSLEIPQRSTESVNRYQNPA